MAYWDKLSGQGNVEDRRGAGPLMLGGLGGLGTVGFVVVVLANIFGGPEAGKTVNDVLGQLQQSQSQQQPGGTGQFTGADSYEVFASTVLGSNNNTWNSVFSQAGQTYQAPRLVLFRDATRSGCGIATSQVGPHYCPADATIYLDETFFEELEKRLGAKGGDVAEAYVIAHEVGHHVQHELGIMGGEAYRRVEAEKGANAASVDLELQADCFAGIWAHSIADKGVFEPGEINEAVDAAEAVGDDRIQTKVNGQVNPETWTHGSSADRSTWFNTGFTTGKPAACDTFKS